jgi:hypothetical protein
MIDTGVFAIYVLLLGLAAATDLSVGRLVDTAFLGAYLALCHQHGFDAIRGTGRFDPLVGTLLTVVPVSVVLACHFVAGPAPLGLLAVGAATLFVPLASLVTRGRRGRKSLVRSIEGWVLLATPVALGGLIAALMGGVGGGVLLVLTSWLEFSFGYAGSGIDWLIPLTVAAAVGWCVVSKLLLRQRWSSAFFSSLGLVYAIGAWLLFVVYYDLPLDHSYQDVATQPHTTMMELPVRRGPGRTLWVDPSERTLYATVKSTKMTADATQSGLFAYDLGTRRETHFVPLVAPCIEMIVDEKNGVIHSCEFFSRRLRSFHLGTLAPAGGDRVLDLPARPEARVRLDGDSELVRFEIPAAGPDLVRLDTRTGRFDAIRVPPRPGVVGSYALALDRERRKVYLPKLGPNRIVLNRLDWNGTFEASVDLEGLSFEAHYSRIHDRVFVATLNRNILYRVSPETLEVAASVIPNGIRAIRETDDGVLVLGDYIRGKIYLYDPRRDVIVATLLCGHKPQALFVTRPGGSLYAYSGFGITRFDLRRILGGLR